MNMNATIFGASYVKKICEIKCGQLYVILSPWGAVFTVQAHNCSAGQ